MYPDTILAYCTNPLRASMARRLRLAISDLFIACWLCYVILKRERHEDATYYDVVLVHFHGFLCRRCTTRNRSPIPSNSTLSRISDGDRLNLTCTLLRKLRYEKSSIQENIRREGWILQKGTTGNVTKMEHRPNGLPFYDLILWNFVLFIPVHTQIIIADYTIRFRSPWCLR